MNIWLIHTFFCYYYFKELLSVISFKNSLLALAIVFVLSITFSMISNFIFNHFKKQSINHEV